MSKNNIKISPIFTITFFVALMMIPVGINADEHNSDKWEEGETVENILDDDGNVIGTKTITKSKDENGR